MEIKKIDYDFSVCKVEDYTLAKLDSEYCFIGKTDEENLGFTYAELDRYIRTGEIDDMEIKAKIDSMHERNLFKLQLMPSFKPEI